MELAQPRDLEQYLALGKRRHNELCRQKRIFNARDRIIGVRSPGREGVCRGVAREAGGGTAEANACSETADAGTAANSTRCAGEGRFVVLTTDAGQDLRGPDTAPSHLRGRQMEPCGGQGGGLPALSGSTET